MKVVILTEGGSAIGFGHLARCSALYHAFRERGVSPIFLVQSDRSIARAVKDVDYRRCNWRDDMQKLRAYLAHAKIAIIDSYLADPALYRYVSSAVETALYFDDFNRLGYPKGIVINAALNASKLAYPKKKATAYLLGASFTPLRKEFWDIDKKKIARKIQNILLTFGGSDMGAMTSKMLGFCAASFPRIKKTVIIGKGFKDIHAIERLKDKKTKLIYFPSIKELKKRMCEADIAICSGGQTLCELARIGTPAIVIGVAPNQRDNINDFSNAGSALAAGWWNERNILSKVLRCANKIKSQHLRLRMNNAGWHIIDGKGAQRVVEMLLDRTIKKEGSYEKFLDKSSKKIQI